MCTRRVCSLLCAVVCAGLLMLGLGSQYGVAQDKNRELIPLADGTILDQNPFDGVGDIVGEDTLSTVFLNVPLAEGRAAMEFDLGNINPHRIESAVLRIVPLGRGILPGTVTIPVQLFGYRGDGTLQPDDFNAGSFITVFDALDTPQNVPVLLDVTEFLQGLRPAKPRIVGFTLRTNVHGVQVTFGSLEFEEFGPPPTLIITLK